ncbi:hypothetical protein T492DRAFT_1039019 [Pavlovales sp. CCMP2436]|nr:hypothetical protein T492DRAFT_1039019 [Pavlovales sp. CCMP2436]
MRVLEAIVLACPRFLRTDGTQLLALLAPAARAAADAAAVERRYVEVRGGSASVRALGRRPLEEDADGSWRSLPRATLPAALVGGEAGGLAQVLACARQLPWARFAGDSMWSSPEAAASARALCALGPGGAALLRAGPLPAADWSSLRAIALGIALPPPAKETRSSLSPARAGSAGERATGGLVLPQRAEVRHSTYYICNRDSSLAYMYLIGIQAGIYVINRDSSWSSAYI